MKSSILLFIFSFIFYSAIALNPSRTYDITPADYGMNYEEVDFKTSDQLKLKGWLFEAPEKSFKVVVISDNGEGNMADNLELVSSFLSLGYHVLTFDYRGYGESDDFKINTKFFTYAQFEKDLNAAIDYLKKRHAKLRTIDLYGLGIGGALSIGVGMNRDDDINKIIADSPYTTFEEIQALYLEKKNEKILVPLGYNKFIMEPQYALEQKVPKIKGVLLIAGENDEIFTEKSIKTLAKIRKGTKTYIVEEATSATTFIKSKQDYFKEIRKFTED